VPCWVSMFQIAGLVW